MTARPRQLHLFSLQGKKCLGKAHALILSSEFQVPTELMLSIKHLDWSKLLTLHLDIEIRTAPWLLSSQPVAGSGLSLAGCGLESRKGHTPGPAAHTEEEGF